MNEDYARQHWVEIDDERLARYQSMFTWSEGARVFYEPASIKPGETVADFGCGPGHTAIEFARWVGSTGHVYGLDINDDFISQANENAERAGLVDRITFLQSDGSELPLDMNSIDCITTRNTMIYVDDPALTLSNFHGALKPGGRTHLIEGDWFMMVVEPLEQQVWQAMIERAVYACRTPDIGRRLTGLLASAGFRDTSLEVISRPDLTGRLFPMIGNMLDFAIRNGHQPPYDLMDVLKAGAERGGYLAVAPQFVATAYK